MRLKQAVWLILVILLLAVGIKAVRYQVKTAAAGEPWRQAAKNDENRLLEAYQHRQSQIPLTLAGRVIKVLPDDNTGSRHQRFIIEIANGVTLLVAHNIDLAPPINGLTYGSQVTVSGEYVWNERGGLMHWTHHDPQGKHPGGWILFRGKKYE